MLPAICATCASECVRALRAEGIKASSGRMTILSAICIARGTLFTDGREIQREMGGNVQRVIRVLISAYR
jgi:hypothetical protein